MRLPAASCGVSQNIAPKTSRKQKRKDKGRSYVVHLPVLKNDRSHEQSGSSSYLVSDCGYTVLVRSCTVHRGTSSIQHASVPERRFLPLLIVHLPVWPTTSQEVYRDHPCILAFGLEGLPLAVS
jgi:hypothetical protein